MGDATLAASLISHGWFSIEKRPQPCEAKVEVFSLSRVFNLGRFFVHRLKKILPMQGICIVKQKELMKVLTEVTP